MYTFTMQYFAGAVLSGGDIFILGIYLLFVAIAIGVIIYSIVKLIVARVKRRSFQKKFIIYILGGILAVAIANIFIQSL
jgi:hypothetical protein